MLAIKRTTYNNIRERLVESSCILAQVLSLDATGLSIAEAGNINDMIKSQLNAAEKKIRSIEICLNLDNS